jgi:3-oxoacyl-[acyl-carrier-protein] synthase-3
LVAEAKLSDLRDEEVVNFSRDCWCGAVLALDDLAREILRKEIDDLYDWLKFVWSEFLKWFTFFCTLNVAAIGALQFVDIYLRQFVEFVFFVLNIGGVVSSTFVLSYTWTIASRVTDTRKKLGATYDNVSKSLLRGTEPFILAAWTGSSIVAAFLLFVSIWGMFLWTGIERKKNLGEPVGIIGTGSFLPGYPVSNDNIESLLGKIVGLAPRLATRMERLSTDLLAKSGISSRYFALDPTTRMQTETHASMAEKAIRNALSAARIEAGSIDLLVIAGPMADYACPPTSAIVQGKLGIRCCTEIEIHSNCTGTPKAIMIALDMLRTGRHRRAAIAYSQLSSTFLRAEYFNPDCTTLRNLALRNIMSDGAGAMILDCGPAEVNLIESYVESIGGIDKPGMIGFQHGSFCNDVALSGKKILLALYESGHHHLEQDIGQVARHAPIHLVEGLARMLAASSLSGSAISRFLLGIPSKHFITPEALEFFRKTIGTDAASRAPFLIEEIGYCGGATILIQFDRLIRSEKIRSGDTVAAYLEESSKWMSGGFLARAA